MIKTDGKGNATVTAKLDLEEIELVIGLLRDEIVKNKIESKFDYLSKRIEKGRYDWHQGHAEYLEGIYEKLVGKKWKL
jgi:hypothetical protein